MAGFGTLKIFRFIRFSAFNRVRFKQVLLHLFFFISYVLSTFWAPGVAVTMSCTFLSFLSSTKMCGILYRSDFIVFSRNTFIMKCHLIVPSDVTKDFVI